MTEKSRRKLDDRSAVPRTERVHREKVSEEQDENATDRSRCKQTTKRVSRSGWDRAWRCMPRAPVQETHRHIEARGPSCLNRFGSTSLREPRMRCSAPRNQGNCASRVAMARATVGTG